VTGTSEYKVCTGAMFCLPSLPALHSASPMNQPLGPTALLNVELQDITTSSLCCGAGAAIFSTLNPAGVRAKNQFRAQAQKAR
jgi:hypothetical protein